LAVPRAFDPVFMFSAPDMFLAVRRASGHVSMFCASGHVFGDTEGVGTRFHVLHTETLF
jgi:hypothetical protein